MYIVIACIHMYIIVYNIIYVYFEGLAQDTPTTRPAAVTQRTQVKDPERPEPKTSENRSCGGYPRAKCGKKKREKIEMTGNSMELMREISLYNEVS